MNDIVPISEPLREALIDLGRARHPTSRRPWLSIVPVEGRDKGESEEESDSPLPAVDLVVG